MPGELHVLLHAAFFYAQADDRTEVVFRHEDVGEDNRLADFRDVVGRGQFARIVNVQRFARGGFDFIDDSRRGGDEVKVVLALQPLLHDFHVQHAEEAAAEAKAQRLRGFRLVKERGVV